MLFMILCFSFLFPKIHTVKNNQEYQDYFINYLLNLENNNQFELSGNVYLHNIEKKAIDSSYFSGIIMRDRKDTILNRSFIINYPNLIHYYNNYNSYKFDKTSKSILHRKIFKKKLVEFYNFTYVFDIFQNFIDSDISFIEMFKNKPYEFLGSELDTSYYFVANENNKNSYFNYTFRTKLNKNNLLPNYYSVTINDYFSIPRIVEWFIDSLNVSKEVDFSKLNFDKYLNEYPIYERFEYLGKSCFFGIDYTGNTIFDSNLTESNHKLVCFYKKGDNLDVNLLSDDIKNANVNIDKYIYRYDDSVLVNVLKDGKYIINSNLLTQYEVDFNPSFYILDKNNKIIKYFYGYNNNKRIDFNKILKEVMN